MTPVIKWAGGKGQILSQIISSFPAKYNTYYEPFLGAGSVLLGTMPQKAVVNDINPQLINIFQQIKNDAKSLIDQVRQLDSGICTKELYMSRRSEFNECLARSEQSLRSAALMIWVNKHCFNGLYRVNKQGVFNAAYNQRTHGESISPDNVFWIQTYLLQSDIIFKSVDFSSVCQTASAGDLVYFDPPYIPVSDTARFTNYSKESFSYEDHQRLAALFKELDAKGVFVVLSNNDVPAVYDLYASYRIEAFEAKRLISRDASKRTGREVIVKNF